MRAFGKWLAGAVAILALGLGAVACSADLRANIFSTLASDNHPFAPFQMAPGLYYVGSSNIAVYALTTRDGIILIDAGYESTAAQVPAHMRALGLAPANVRIILNTHAHVDHAAGLAALKRLTGAQLYANPRDAPLLESGGHGDFFLHDWMTFPPVHVDRLLRDGEVVRLGERELTAHFTPGHTKGCTSWSFSIQIEGQIRQALIICSLSTLQYRLVNNRDYPEIVTDYEHTYDVLHHLPCEVFLGAHGVWFDLIGKRRRQEAGAAANPFVDPEGCSAFIDRSEQTFHATLARQQG